MSNKKIGKLRKRLSKKIRKFWENYEQKIILGVGMILLAIISFEVGILQGQKWQQDPLIIEKPDSQTIKICNQKNQVSGADSNQTKGKANKINASNNLSEIKKDCAFVGSKKSNKYHKIDCRFARKIKPQNLICFKSEQDARDKGYVPAHCVK